MTFSTFFAPVSQFFGRTRAEEALDELLRALRCGVDGLSEATGPLSSLFDVTTCALLWWVFGANTPVHQSLFQSGWFIEGLVSQTLIVHLIRTRRIPFLQSTATMPVLLLTSTIVGAGLILPFSTVGRTLGMVSLPLSYFPWLVATILAYATLVQVVKIRYIRRFDAWL